MKKYILMPVLAALSLSGSVIQAQDFIIIRLLMLATVRKT